MTSTATEGMRAWLYSTAAGGLHKNLTLSTTAAHPRPTAPPRLAKGEVLVRVRAASLNPIDYKLPELPLGLSRAVISVPASPGMDFAGVVVALGPPAAVADTATTGGAPEPSPLQVGDEVFGRLDPGRFGALGEYVVAQSLECAALPADLGFEKGAGVGSAGMAAFYSIVPHVPVPVLPAAKGEPGQFRVFINGGSGGTGTFGIQIAKALGCHVTTSCSTPNVALCRDLGADEVLDYTREDVVGRLRAGGPAFGLVVDNVGAPADLYTAADAFLVPGGSFVQVGAGLSVADMGSVASRMLRPAFLGGGARRFEFLRAKTRREDFARLAAWVAAGEVRVVVDEVFEFEDAPRAYEKLRTGRARGKIIVKGAP